MAGGLPQGQQPLQQLRARWIWLLVGLGAVLLAVPVWFVGEASRRLWVGLPYVLLLFVYAALGLGLLALTVAWVLTVRRLWQDEEQSNFRRFLDILFVVGYAVAVVWLVHDLLGAPQSAFMVRLQRLLGRQDFSELDMSGFDLEGIALPGCDLHESNLNRANLQGAYLKGANLHRAAMSETILRAADLRAADLSGAYLHFARLEGADASDADFSEARMRWIKLTGANLSRAILSGANLRWARAIDTSFREANLASSNLSRVDLRRSDLLGAGLADADMSYVDLRGALVTYVQLTQARSLTGATGPDGTALQ